MSSSTATTLSSRFRELVSSSTVHGLAWIANSERRVDRAAWAAVVAVSFACAAAIIRNSFREWDANPVIIT